MCSCICHVQFLDHTAKKLNSAVSKWFSCHHLISLRRLVASNQFFLHAIHKYPKNANINKLERSLNKKQRMHSMHVEYHAIAIFMYIVIYVFLNTYTYIILSHLMNFMCLWCLYICAQKWKYEATTLGQKIDAIEASKRWSQDSQLTYLLPLLLYI